jgi:hypothetical protein
MSSFLTSNEHFLKRARNIRNELLNKTDRYMLEDYPNLSSEELTNMKAYRQALREYININKDKILNGEKIDFPTQPDFININII